MARCAAITRAGTCCKLDASYGGYCRQHAHVLVAGDEDRQKAEALRGE